jgi:hypothetical protein
MALPSSIVKLNFNSDACSLIDSWTKACQISLYATTTPVFSLKMEFQNCAYDTDEAGK